jgi:hypothetical protein
MATIFIQISSYRDPELFPTITNAIKQSSGKHSLHFGLHVSYLEESEIAIPKLPNIKYTTSKAPENVGVGIGRYIAHSFYNGEDFYLQCDSHMRFVENWDEVAIDSIKEYQNQGIKKPLLTMYPANYWYKDITFTETDTDLLDKNYCTVISFHKDPEAFKKIRVPSQTAMPSNKSIFTKSISAGSLFTVGPFMAPNKDMAFWGEEIIMAARAYTHGYDLMVPKQQYLYHLYYNSEKPEINRRKIFWHDFPNEFERMNKKSQDLVYKILVEEMTGDGFLGTERSLSEYGMFAGLDFLHGIVFEPC